MLWIGQIEVISTYVGPGRHLVCTQYILSDTGRIITYCVWKYRKTSGLKLINSGYVSIIDSFANVLADNRAQKERTYDRKNPVCGVVPNYSIPNSDFCEADWRIGSREYRLRDIRLSTWVRMSSERMKKRLAMYTPAYDSPARYKGREAREGKIATMFDKNSTWTRY
jgi:hypothetical protein